MRGQKEQEAWGGLQEAELRWNKACRGGVEGRVSTQAGLKEVCSQSGTSARNKVKWKGHFS